MPVTAPAAVQDTTAAAPTKRNPIYKAAEFTPANLNQAKTVFHLHGSLADPTGMVMTTRDYITRYANDRAGNDPKNENRTLTFLSHLFQEKTVLFIGYGLGDLEILEYVIQKGRMAAPGQEIQARHYMVQGYFSHELELMRSLSQYYMQTDIQLIPFLLDHKDWPQLIEVTAIKDQPEASQWFLELSSDPALGSPTEHPDFLSYHEMWSGPGPTPFGEESLVAFAEDGTIVDRLNEFKERDSWKGPTLGGLVAALEAAVAASPNTFLPLLSDFHRAKIPFQHALISGFKRVFDPSNAQKPAVDWNVAWPKLMTFFSEYLNDEAFWASKPEENVNLIPTRSWMTTLIAGFLEAGTKDDKTAYSPELLPKGWELIKILLQRAEDEKASLTDPMTHALNTEKGRVIGQWARPAEACGNL
jgi:hypothetical protein